MKRAILCAMAVLLSVGAEAAFTSGTITNVVHTTYLSYATSTGTLELQVGGNGPVQILEVRVHLNAAGTTQTLTVYEDSGLGSAYDAVLDTQAMVSATDHIFRPTGECIIPRDSLLKVAWANAGVKAWGCVILWRKL